MIESKNMLKQYIRKNDCIVIANSGGPDSMCLLHLLLDYRKDTNIQIICAHVNHKVRLESDSEEMFVKNFCVANDVIFEVLKIDEYSDDNFHQYARNKRYEFFESLIKKYNAKFLMTAHHGDDLIESVLMRVVRGSTIKGYAGFESVLKRNNYTILRPLIFETKSSILEYNNENKIEYVTDVSNLKDVYTRNRYRKYILPELKKEDDNVHHKFKKFSDSLIETEKYIEKQTEDIFNCVYVDNKLDLLKFKKIDIFIQKRLIQYILNKIYKDNVYLITDKHTNIILNIIDSGNPNGYIYLPLNKIILKNRDILFFDIDLIDKEYKYVFNKEQILPNGFKISLINEVGENSNFICRLNSKEVKLPLIVRTRRDGEVMSVKNMAGSKKINDIFTDSKISLLEREIWPIVTDSDDKVVWLPGLKKSKFDIEKDKIYDIILKYH